MTIQRIALILFLWLFSGIAMALEPLPPWETVSVDENKTPRDKWEHTFSPELAIEWVDGDNEGLRSMAKIDSELKSKDWSISASLEAYRWQETTFGRDKRDIFLNELRLEKTAANSVIRAGRYRTVIGGGVIWNPFDVLDPVNPNRISLSRRGGDKVSLDLIDSNGGITSFYGFPEDEGRSSGFCLRHRKTVKSLSFQPFVFKFDNALWSYGVELTGNVGKNASWMQVGRLADERGVGLQLLLGFDLAIPRAPLLRIEYFRNGLRPLDGSAPFYSSVPPGPGFDLRQNFLRSSAENSVGLNIEGARGSLGLRFDALFSCDDRSSLFHLSLDKTLSKDVDGLFSVWYPLDDGTKDYDGERIITFGLKWKQ